MSLVGTKRKPFNEIIISDFSGGVVQNADLEDIPKNAVVVLKNLRPILGRLVKTFGLQRDYPDPSGLLGNDTYNLTTYHNPNFADVRDDEKDFAYIAVKVSSNLVNLLQWNPDKTGGAGWDYCLTGAGVDDAPLGLQNGGILASRYYHDTDKNPIIHNDGTMRLLPGNVSSTSKTITIVGGSHTLHYFTVDDVAWYPSLFPTGQAFSFADSSNSDNDGDYVVLRTYFDGTYLRIYYNSITGDKLDDSTPAGSITVGSRAMGIWIGYIDRDFFDVNYEPTAGFYHYETVAIRPELNTLQIQSWRNVSDYAFSPRDMEQAITSLDSVAGTVTILGAWAAQIHPGSYIEIFGHPLNAGEWEVVHALVELDEGTPKTTIEINGTLPDNEDVGYVRFASKATSEAKSIRKGSAVTLVAEGTPSSYSPDFQGTRRAMEAAGLSESYIAEQERITMLGYTDYLRSTPATGGGGGHIISEKYDPAALGVVRYYKFAYVYDGVQESLMSEAYKMQYFPTSMGSFFLPINEDTHNLRITGINVYRASLKDGPYAKVLYIDFLRKAAQFQSATATSNGVSSCRRRIYLPVLAGGDPGAGTDAIQIKFKTEDMQDYGSAYVCNETEITDGSDVLTLAVGQTDLVRDYWNCKAEISSDGGSNWTIYQGVYAGYKTLIYESPLEDLTYAGGVVVIDQGAVGGNLKITSGDNEGELIGGRRVILANYKRALHVAWMLGSNATGEGEFVADQESVIMTQERGLYYTDTFGDEGFGYLFHDVNLPRSTLHPLEGELSVETNGAFARLISGRLFQGNLILDPAGEAETHVDWMSYSALGQYDVNPASNIMRFPDREGGPITGIAELFGNVVVMKRQSIRFLGVKHNPGNPAAWGVVETVHNIGNIAPRGYVEAGGSVFVCFYDGIYRLSPNNLAPTDQTPTERLKISEPIGNIYEAMTYTQKTQIKAVFNQWKEEIIFLLTYTDTDSVDHPDLWAYNIRAKSWRQIASVAGTGSEGAIITPSLFALDEKAQVLAYETATNGHDSKPSVYRILEESEDVPSGQIQESVQYYVSGADYYIQYGGNPYGAGQTSRSFDGESGIVDYTDDDDTKGSDGKIIACNIEAEVRIRDITVSGERAERVRYVYITYKSPSILQVRFYTEGNTTAAETLELPASAVWHTYKLCPAIRAERFTMDIAEDFSENLITAETALDYDYLVVGRSGGVNPNIEIGKVRILTD